MDEEFEERPALSTAALDALKEFYADEEARAKQFEDLKLAAENHSVDNPALTMDAFSENWNESQFWYSEETATILANQLLANATNETTIAVISAPSAFVQLKNILAASGKADDQKPKIYLLEFDKRFGVFPEFVFYNFHNPLGLPSSMKASVDHIICDPPFLSEDCQTKAALTVRWLSRSWGLTSDSERSKPRLIVCTGERMASLVTKLYRPQGLATTTFEPVHAKGLSNEFYCYANFECSDWGWKS